MLKNNILYICSIFTFSSNIAAQEGKDSTTTSNKYELVWHDEFDYEGLPDSNKWSYEEGMPRGVQKQYYTKKRLTNASVHNGVLTITARKEIYQNPQYKLFKKERQSSYPKKYLTMSPDSVPSWVRIRYDSIINYTSASLTTLGKGEWKFGRIEIKAKLPSGQGISCALWMLGTNVKEVSWPACGEIDIMESVGKYSDQITGTVHFIDSNAKHKQFGNKTKLSKIVENYHTYALDWNSDSIVLSADGVVFNKFPSKKIINDKINPFNKSFYLLMNIAVGSGTWAGPLDDSVLPQKMVIDYVRVYQTKFQNIE